MSKIMWLDWSKMAKQFSVTSRGKSLCQYQASRQAGKPAICLESFFLRILDTFHPFNLSCYLVKYTVLFVLGKCLMDSEEVILIFTEAWLYIFNLS